MRAFSAPRRLVAALVGCLLAAGCSGSAQSTAEHTQAPTRPEHRAPAKPGEPTTAGSEVDVLLCDGKTKASFPKNTAGSAIAAALMDEWMRNNPDRGWETKEREAHALQPAADNREVIGQVAGHTHGAVTEQDVLIWKRETERLATAGSRVFHDAEELGSTVGVSCDMCHPHAANTHPETYPKFQQQLGRAVLLRDMINWCIEHPVRGRPLEPDDPRMRALEAYILAQRRGKALEYGRH